MHCGQMSAGHLGLVGLVEVLQAETVAFGTTPYNSLPLSSHVDILVPGLARLLHRSGECAIAGK